MSYRIDPRLPLTMEIRRIATEELESALGHLATAGADPDKALHDCRKRLKSVRALIRLVRSGNPQFARAENARCQKASARLAAPREAAALVETLDRLAAEYPGEVAGGTFDPIRNDLLARHAAVLDQDLSKAVDAAAATCRTVLRQFDRLTLPDQIEDAAGILAAGVRKTMQRAFKAFRRAKERGDPSDFHDLRKAIKAHTRHLALLRKVWPSRVKPQIKKLDALGEQLGDLHDILVLRALLSDGASAPGGPELAQRLDRLARRTERRLRKTSLGDAADLFRDSPKRSPKSVARKMRKGMAETAAGP